MRVLWFLAFLFLSLTARADWKAHPESIVVKVYSCFSKQPDSCLEGTGVLIGVPEYGGNVEYLRVLTSEHVVLPTNEGVFHRVVDSKGRTSKALFYRSNWENGIAMLGIVESAFTDDWRKDFPSLRTVPRTDDKTKKSLSAIGFPAGSTRVVRTANGQSLGLMGAGKVLGDWRIIETRGMQTEFGMSGGPVFTDDGGFFGLLSHVNFDADPKTFVIPMFTVADWASNPWDSDFYRTLDDIKRQAFTKTKPEKIRVRDLEMTIEKIDKRFIVTLPNSWRNQNKAESKLTRLLTHGSGVGELASWMIQTDLKTVVFDKDWKGGEIGSLSIEAFVGSYLSSGSVPYQTIEGIPADPGRCDPSLKWSPPQGVTLPERYCSYH